MGIIFPTGVKVICDHEDCMNQVEISLKNIKSGFTKKNIIKKLRKLGWYASEKRNLIICPLCKEKLGLSNLGRKKEME